MWAAVLVLLCLPIAGRSRVVGVLLTAVAVSILAFIAYGVSHYFTGKGITEAVWYHAHMLFNLQLAMQFWYLWLVGVCALLGLAALLWWWGRFCFNRSVVVLSPFVRALVLVSLFVLALASVVWHPAVMDSYKIARQLYSQGGPNVLAQQLGGQVNQVTAVTPRNFVYLYLESFERIFLDDARFPDLTPNLNRLFAQSTAVRHVYTAPMTGWTMAGMMSSQCGLPLSTIASATDAVGNIANLRCVGDILHDSNYYLTYMGGADAAFSKKGRFYSSHGFSEVYGTAELEALAGHPLSQSSWGVYDDKLLDMGFAKFEALAKNHDRFGLVLLTADTHQPKGHKTPECKGVEYGDGKSGMLNSVKCADFLVSRFIRRFLDSPYSKDVVLVVASDHLLMGNDAGIEEETETRENLLVMFQSGQKSIHDRQATKFDIAPTLLHALGFEISELNFGRNLYKPEPTLSEYYGRSEFNRLLYVWRKHLEDEWAK
jgi:phosphoglycerol transferase